jgi:hypothetical protein
MPIGTLSDERDFASKSLETLCAGKEPQQIRFHWKSIKVEKGVDYIPEKVNESDLFDYPIRRVARAVFNRSSVAIVVISILLSRGLPLDVQRISCKHN